MFETLKVFKALSCEWASVSDHGKQAKPGEIGLGLSDAQLEEGNDCSRR